MFELAGSAIFHQIDMDKKCLLANKLSLISLNF